MFKIFGTPVFLLLFLACGGGENPADFFDIKLEGKGKKFTVNQKVGIKLINQKDFQVNEVNYFLDDQKLPLSEGKVTLQTQRLGKKMLKAVIELEDQSVEVEREIQVLSDTPPSIYTYEIINEYPHDIQAFTQGLEFYQDTLYESTGQKGASVLRKVNFENGEVYQETALESQFFGEGITILNDRVYQLTWQSGVGFTYGASTLEKTGSFKYGSSKEGWGLCNDGEQLYKSDGTEKIWLLDPATLDERGYIQIVTNNSLFNKTNELEYVNGKIYANVWQKPSMMIINAKTGAIEGVVNFGGLDKKVTQHEQLDVLNGVAYHPGRKTFFVTGKRWDKLFEVRIFKRD